MTLKEITWMDLSGIATDGERWFGGIGLWKPLFIERKPPADLYTLYCCAVYHQKLALSATLKQAKKEGEALPTLIDGTIRWEMDGALKERYFGNVNGLPLYSVRFNQSVSSWTAAQNPIGFNELLMLQIPSKEEAMQICQDHFKGWVGTLFIRP